MNKHIVLVASPSGAFCDRVKTMLEAQGGLEVKSHVMLNGGADFSAQADTAADLLILDLGEQGSDQMLVHWAGIPGERPPMIVVGPADDAQLMRHAMQAGARDYLAHPVPGDELPSAVRQVLSQLRQPGTEIVGRGRLTAVVNAKGGSGASVIAANLAHILTAFLERETAVLDMDLQFGALPLSFDLQTRHNVVDVIGAVEQLDPVALRGYMTRHQSGLDVLGSMSDQLVMPWEVSSADVRKLLELAVQTYDHVVADLSRDINPVTGVVLGSADRVLVVMQQSFAHLRDAKRMFELLRNYLGVPSQKLTLVVNRHTDRNSITVDDVRDAVHPAEVMFVPNDYVNVTNALNVGLPLLQTAKGAPITRALCNMAERVDAGQQAKPPQDGQKKPPTRWHLPRLLGLSG